MNTRTHERGPWRPSAIETDCGNGAVRLSDDNRPVNAQHIEISSGMAVS